MATTIYRPETVPAGTTRLPPSAWRDYRSLRLMALRTDPHAFEASLDAQRALPDTWWQDQLRDTMGGDRAWLLFAEQEQRLVGMIGARVCDGPHVAEINSVFVAPEARGQGIGSALMRGMLDDLNQDPALQWASLHVNAAQTVAFRLYKRFGFQLVETERLMCGDGVIRDVCLMEKHLA